MLQCARFFALVKVRGFEQHQLTKGLQAARFLLLVPDASKLHPDSSQIFPRVEKLACSANNSEGLSTGYEIPTTQIFEDSKLILFHLSLMIWPTDNSNQSLLATSRDKSWHINKRQLVFFPIHAHIFWETLAKPIQNHSISKFKSSEMASTTLWSRYEFGDQVKAKVKAMHVLKIHIERDHPNKYYIIPINTYIERLSHARCARTIFIHELRWKKKKKKTNERALRTGKFVNAS